MNKTNVKKPLAVAVIFLFIGLALAPSINANITKDSELVEFTTEVCGLNGGKQTVQLTKEEAEGVEQLFDSIKERLDEVETKEETVKIFKEAIVELNSYRLLGDLSIEQAQRLVTIRYQHPFYYRVFNRIHKRIIMMLDENENLLCQIAGKTIETVTGGIPFFPVKLLRDIDYGKVVFNPGIYYIPASGWIFTDGLNGIITWNKSFYGQYGQGTTRQFVYWYTGAKGFTGLWVTYGLRSHFYLGFALRVKLGPNHPE